MVSGATELHAEDLGSKSLVLTAFATANVILSRVSRASLRLLSDRGVSLLHEVGSTTAPKAEYIVDMPPISAEGRDDMQHRESLSSAALYFKEGSSAR